ncbi:penicillin-binding protein 2 [Dyella sp. KRB-257]|uniref:penicillin-binding protein 2 n=1 Tax=Dyella sp. KRB-257 TaxID=3400915 RepID=UPI003BFD9806
MSKRRGSRLHRAIKDPRGENALFRQRALAGFGIILLGLLVLVGRYAFLQVLHHDEFATRSEANRVKPRAIPPARGLIYDRNGVLLADNVPAFRLEVVPEQVPDMKAMLAQIGAVVPLSDDDIDAFKKQLAQSRRFDSVPLKLHLSEDDIARFAINRWRFPGVDVVPYLTRRYPFGARFAHIIGYVGRIDDNDLKRLDPVRYKGTTHVGRSGLERAYEGVLHGTPGYELVEVNADGRTQRVLETHPPIPGKNLYLSIDTRIQKAAEDAFAGRPGAAVAIDPRNGQVLAMVSVPSFDPNLFVNGISAVDYRTLTSDPDKPLYNRALRGVYPPGSTVKPLIGLAGLEAGIRTPQDTVVSTGQYCIPGTTFCRRDDQRGGVGRVDLAEAIEQSVNTYFYKLALDLGIDRLSAYMSKFGFGRPTGIDLVGESDGVLPSREWKQAHSREPWYPGETMIAGIGQGYWAVTPIQLAHAIATFAGHGVPYAPRLVMATQDSVETGRRPLPNPPQGPSLITEPAYWNAVDRGMQLVMYGDKGTGRALTEGFPYRLAGKSGTAERYSRKGNTYDDRSNLAYLATRNRAWFEVYAPADDPQIAVVAVLEAGAWGASSAGPITRHILDAWLAAKGRAAPPFTPYRDDAIGNAPAPVEDLPVAPADAQPAQAGSTPDHGGTP